MIENLKRHRPDIKVLGEGRAIAFMPESPMGVWVHIQDVEDMLSVKDKEITKLKESHKNEVGQLLMKIAELEKLVETADKLLKPRGCFSVKDITFNGVKLEGFDKEA